MQSDWPGRCSVTRPRTCARCKKAMLGVNCSKLSIGRTGNAYGSAGAGSRMGDLGQVRKEQASTRQLAIFGIERSNAAANPHRCVDQTAVVPACFLYRGGPDRAVAHRHVERHILSLRHGRMHQTLYFDPLPIVRPGQQASEAHPGSGYRQMRLFDHLHPVPFDHGCEVPGTVTPVISTNVPAWSLRSAAFGIETKIPAVASATNIATCLGSM